MKLMGLNFFLDDHHTVNPQISTSLQMHCKCPPSNKNPSSVSPKIQKLKKLDNITVSCLNFLIFQINFGQLVLTEIYRSNLTRIKHF